MDCLINIHKSHVTAATNQSDEPFLQLSVCDETYCTFLWDVKFYTAVQATREHTDC